MGMSASQARFLSLTARKNNVEFHGQQINQQRTTLSNESANYYSELTNLAVPIPPSIDDYTKISYTFEDGAVNNTLTSLYPDKNNKSKYIVNYLQSWNDDYAIVPASSSMVETDNPKNPTKFSIGSQTLRKAGTAPAASDNDEYYNSLSASQQADLLKNESYLLSMAQEKTGDNGNFYIRYIQNTTTGQYEPYLYAESELTQSQKYNNKNLGSIPCFSLGTTTKTQEVLNKSAFIEKDASGRFVAITIDDGIGTKAIPHNNLDEIEEYYRNTPFPKQQDYTKVITNYIPRNNQSAIDAYWANNAEPKQEDFNKQETNYIPRNNQDAIDEYLLTHLEPKQEDYTKINTIPKNNQSEIDEYILTHPEPDKDDYKKYVTDTKLSSIFTAATAGGNGCYDHVLDTSYSNRSGCYKHVLAHMIDLEVETVNVSQGTKTVAKSSAYPKSGIQTSIPGYTISILATDINNSNINSYNHTAEMLEISNALKNGYTPTGETQKVTIMAGDKTANASSPESDKLLSDYYIKNGGGTLKQKLMSNYYIDENGDIAKKTLRQKAIDLFYLCDHLSELGADIDADLVPAVVAFQNDMQNFTIFKEEEYEKDHEEWVKNTTLKEWNESETVPDVDAYTLAHQTWENGIPAYQEWYDEETITVPDVDAFNNAHDAWLNGAPEYKEWEDEENTTVPDTDAYNQALDNYKNAAPSYRTWDEYVEESLGTRTYKLKTTTSTDEDAYNNAMNQYNYDKAIYDQKIQEINSKIKIIQQQDKNLELKLKQLDTEENAIQTEMDAVKKVISKNVESSFKTFNA